MSQCTRARVIARVVLIVGLVLPFGGSAAGQTLPQVCQDNPIDVDHPRDTTIVARLPSAGATACYRFTVPTGAAYTQGIYLSSDDFDAVLRLYDENGNQIATNDDYLDELNSFIGIQLNAGRTYHVVVDSFDPDDGGEYWLDVYDYDAERGLDVATVLGAKDPRPVWSSRLAMCTEKSDPGDVDPLDFLHPSAFLRVVERTQDHERIILYNPIEKVPSGDHDRLGPNGRWRPRDWAGRAEVDHRSTIVIEFDREYLVDNAGRFDLRLAVQATSAGGSQTHDLEVLGYRVIGQASEPATASVAAGLDMIGKLCALQDAVRSRPVRRFVEAADTASDGASLRRIATGSAPPLVRWEADFDALMREDTADLEPIADLIRSRPERLLTLVNNVKTTGVAFRDSLPSLPADGSASTEDTARVEGLTKAFVESVYDLQELLGMLNDALGYQRAPERDDQRPTLLEIESPRETSQDTTRGDERRQEVWERLGRRLIPRLRNAEISLPKHNVKPGEVVSIVVTNQVDRDAAGRAMPIHLEVVDFGLSRKPDIRDSFFFLTRNGIPDGESRFFNTDPTDVASTLEGAVKSPLPARAVPTPGASALWSWYPRGDEKRHRLARFFQPGFGVNVSFPSFGTRIQEFKEATDSTLATLVTSDSTQAINVALGGVVHIWDGTVQFTFGRNLSIGQKPWYWGVGLSFVSLSRKIASDEGGS